MLYSVYKDLVFGTYFIDALTFIQGQHMFNAILDNNTFEVEPEPQNTKTFLQSFNPEQPGLSGDDRLVGKNIAIHAVRGTMLKHDAVCGPVGMRTIGDRIKEADLNESVIAHLIIFETGGGQVISVPEITEAISKATKKTYGFVDGYALSAGQYALSYCDEKWASRDTDRLGSIGAMMAFKGRKSGEADKDGQLEFRIYATKSVQKNKEFESALNKGDVSFAVEQLDELNDQFHKDIKVNYPNVQKEHLTGATFAAKDVIGVLIDGIKPFDALIAHIGDQYLENNPEISNHNQKMMKQFNSVNSTLGVESLESADGSVSLNEEQMEAINVAIVAGETAQSQIATAQAAQVVAETAQATAVASLATANEKITLLETGVGADTAAQIAATDGTGKGVVSSLAADMKAADELITAYEKQK